VGGLQKGKHLSGGKGGKCSPSKGNPRVQGTGIKGGVFRSKGGGNPSGQRSMAQKAPSKRTRGAAFKGGAIPPSRGPCPQGVREEGKGVIKMKRRVK